MLARVRCSVPALRLVDDGSNDFILNHCVHIDVVVHAAENTVLVRIAYIEVVEKLKPECFELVRVVLEQVEVVADSRQNLVKASLQFSSILFHFERLLACCSALVLVLHQRLDLLREHLDLLVDQVVFLGIFLQFVAHCSHDAINLVLKQVLQLADADVVARLAANVLSISRQAGTPGLVLQNRHNVGVVLTVLLRPFAIVKVDEHIGEALVQSVVNGGVGLLAARLLLWLGLLLLTVGMLLLRVRVLLGISLPVVLRLLLRLLWLLLSLMLLLVLLEALSVTGLALVTIGARLTVLIVRIGCGLLSPGLVLVLNLRADVLIMLVAIESLFFRVLVIFLITLVLALFIVSLTRFSGDWLRLASASRRPRARSWVLSLRAVMILVMRCLLLLLVDHVVHSHYLRLTLRVLTLVILGSSRWLLLRLFRALLLSRGLRSESLRLLRGDGGADIESRLHHHGGVGIVIDEALRCLIVPAI